MLVHVIADYGYGDLAFAEVVQRLKLYLPDAQPVLTPVPPFATLTAGLCAAQLGLNPTPDGTLIFHNVAPRKDNGAARKNNDGERLACARLPTGVQVVGVNAGYAFSYLKDVAEELHYVRVDSAGSQFRSRDLFPQAVAAIALGDAEALAEPLPPAHIPDLPPAHIAYIDGFGNLKTTLRYSEKLEPGSSVPVRIGETELEATLSDGAFSVPQGRLALSPGSSGWPGPDGKQIRWMELFLRGGSAWEAFGRPGVGDEISLGVQVL